MNQTQPTRSAMPTFTHKAWRVRFAPDAASTEPSLRRFADPSPASAIADAVDIAELPREPQGPEPVNHLYILVAPLGTATRLVGSNWLSPPEQIDAPRAISMPFDKGKLSWRPGRVLVERNTPLPESTLAAICEFAFYEAELRKLEDALRPHETQAASDAAFAHRIRVGDQEHWDRFDKAMQALALMRLSFARLEPRLYVPDRSLPPEQRHLIARLSRRAAIEERCEAFSDRLETCEQLYEGAVDRISDYRWYRKGNILEIAIVILLSVEVIQLFADMIVRLVLHVPK